VPSGVNSLQVSAGISGQATSLFNQGADTNIGIAVSCKGTGDVTFFSQNFTYPQFAIRGIFNSVNYAEVFGSVSGQSILIRSQGSDANIPVGIYAKGTGSVDIGYNGAANPYLSLTTARAIFSQIVKVPSFTVATLPTGTLGDRATVSDATAPTFLTALTGGGAIKCPAFHNGTTWVAG
jgi:hypothetical protein